MLESHLPRCSETNGCPSSSGLCITTRIGNAVVRHPISLYMELVRTFFARIYIGGMARFGKQFKCCVLVCVAARENHRTPPPHPDCSEIKVKVATKHWRPFFRMSRLCRSVEMTVLRSRLDTTTAGAMDASHNTYVDIGESGKGSHEKGGGNLHLRNKG